MSKRKKTGPMYESDPKEHVVDARRKVSLFGPSATPSAIAHSESGGVALLRTAITDKVMVLCSSKEMLARWWATIYGGVEGLEIQDVDRDFQRIILTGDGAVAAIAAASDVSFTSINHQADERSALACVKLSNHRDTSAHGYVVPENPNMYAVLAAGETVLREKLLLHGVQGLDVEPFDDFGIVVTYLHGLEKEKVRPSQQQGEQPKLKGKRPQPSAAFAASKNSNPPPVAAPGWRIEEVPVDRLDPSPHNRRKFEGKDKDNAELQELAASLKLTGQQQNLVVRVRPGIPDRWSIIAGERRWRAAKLAGLKTLVARVVEVDDAGAACMTVVENLQRADLSLTEQADEVGGLLAEGLSIDEVADRIGKPRKWVARRSRLAQLDPEWRALLVKPGSQVGGWSPRMLELVATLAPQTQREFLADLGTDVTDELPSWDVPLDEDDLRERIADFTRLVARAPWDPTDATLLPIVGACTSCPHNSAMEPSLFDDGEASPLNAEARCLRRDCWESKAAETIARRTAEIREKTNAAPILVDDSDEPAPGSLASVSLPKPVDPGTKGAVPAIVLTGPDAGRELWFKKKDVAAAPERRNAPGSIDRSPPSKAAARPKSFKEKVAELEARRKALARTMVLTKLWQTEPPTDAKLLAALSVFGTAERQRFFDGLKTDVIGQVRTIAGGGSDDLSYGRLDPWSQCVKLEAAKSDTRRRLWVLLVATIEDVTKIFTVGTDAADRWECLVDACEFFDLDFAEQCLADATKAIPTPKSWGVPDAAPDGKAAAAGDASAAAAKPRKKKPTSKAAAR